MAVPGCCANGVWSKTNPPSHANINGLTPDSVAMGDTISEIRQLWGGDRARKADSSELVDVNSEKLNNREVRAAVRRNRRVRDLGE